MTLTLFRDGTSHSAHKITRIRHWSERPDHQETQIMGYVRNLHRSAVDGTYTVVLNKEGKSPTEALRVKRIPGRVTWEVL
jgi:hypothetical protein